MLSRSGSVSSGSPGHTQATNGITEIVLAHNQSLSFVLPSLAFLSQQHSDRWLTWLPLTTVTKPLLQNYSFDFSRTRFIYPKSRDQAFQLFLEALTKGNSHTVVGAPGPLTEQQMARLEQAAAIGNCSGLVLRDRRAATFRQIQTTR